MCNTSEKKAWGKVWSENPALGMSLYLTFVSICQNVMDECKSRVKLALINLRLLSSPLVFWFSALKMTLMCIKKQINSFKIMGDGK